MREIWCGESSPLVCLFPETDVEREGVGLRVQEARERGIKEEASDCGTDSEGRGRKRFKCGREAA